MAEAVKTRKGRPPSDKAPFPRCTLLQAIKLAQSINDNNAGQAYSRISLAESIESTPESSFFRNLITASSRYGLTDGSYKSEKIALTSIGLSIVSPRTDDEKNSGLQKALLSPELFNQVYTKFNSHKIPPVELFENTLVRDFNVATIDKKICAELIIKNAEELGIITEIKGSKYLQLEKLGMVEISDKESTPVGEIVEDLDEDTDGESEKIAKRIDPKFLIKPTIFISHSKNIKILEQIKQILSFGEFEYKIAVEQETTAIPIPEKIFGFMRECNCALINVSADEQERKEDGSYGVNPNVLIEIGGAFLLYDKRVILLVDKRVKLPSNLQGLYRSEYEGDELTWDTGIKLQNTLTQFKELLKKGDGKTDDEE